MLIDIVQACREQRQIRVTDEIPDGRRIPNETETFAAQEKAEALQRALLAVPPYQRDPQPLGNVGGLHLQASGDSWLGQPRYVVSLVEVPRVHLLVEAGEVRQPNIGLVTRVENLPRCLERVLDDVAMDTGKINREAEKAQAGLVDVFPRAG